MADRTAPAKNGPESTMFDLAGEEGVNDSERILTELCRKSFPRLWAHANLYTDAGFKDKSKSIKELFDALVRLRQRRPIVLGQGRQVPP